MKKKLWIHFYVGKCDSATCTTLAACMTDPTSTTCTATYGGAMSLPTLAGLNVL